MQEGSADKCVDDSRCAFSASDGPLLPFPLFSPVPVTSLFAVESGARRDDSGVRGGSKSRFHSEIDWHLNTLQSVCRILQAERGEWLERLDKLIGIIDRLCRSGTEVGVNGVIPSDSGKNGSSDVARSLK
jgi:hypothetical protein